MGTHNFKVKTRTIAGLVLSLLLSVAPLARPGTYSSQPARNASQATERAQLHQALLDLSNPWTVMCVAAHPDDEDGITLTVLRRKFGVHTVTLFSTYGEGGQNAVGPELYEKLGVIRARETMAAAQVQGSEPHFLGMRDFGFSKSADETFRVWDEREAFRRMVLQIRTLRPDVIITNHDTKSGHGHHQATGQLVLKAFDAASDPKQFPEQLSTVGTWQVQRLFVRGFRNQSTSGTEATQPVVTIDPNENDPIRGTTYAQQALLGLQQHATQGPWPKTLPPNGGRIVRYNLVRQSPTAGALPANPKTPLDGLVLPESIASHFVAPTIDNKPLLDHLDNRGEVLVSLINARKRGAFSGSKEVVALDPHRFQLMSSRLDTALAVTANVTLTLNANEPVLVPGADAMFTTSLSNSGDTQVEIKNISFRGLAQQKSIDAADKLLPSTDTSGKAEVSTPKAAKLSVPAAEHLYDGRLFGEPISAVANLEIEGAPFSISSQLYRDVAPLVEILDVTPSPYVITPARAHEPLNLKVTLRNNQSTPFRGLVRINGVSLETGRELSLAPHATSVVNVDIRSTVATMRRNQTNSSLTVTVDLPIPKEPITSASVSLIHADALVSPNLKVGYVPSFDETLEQSLVALGVNATRLSVEDIQKEDLANFSTIIIDNRGYEAHPELITANDRLLKYTQNGGTLIVFYHKTEEWNPDAKKNRPQLAPYPIVIDDSRVTEEDAPIKVLEAGHPLLNTPNRITQADFANWIQERGLYFPKEWDSHYTALLSTNDKGEPALNGGLLVAPYGKGNYIYTSMVWYRQLRAGLPGGYRFFANLISYGHGKDRGTTSARKM